MPTDPSTGKKESEEVHKLRKVLMNHKIFDALSEALAQMEFMQRLELAMYCHVGQEEGKEHQEAAQKITEALVVLRSFRQGLGEGLGRKDI